MARTEKICTLLLIGCLVAPAAWVFGQTKTRNNKKQKPDLTIGIHFGGTVNQKIQSPTGRHTGFARTNALSLKKQVSGKFAAEARISYSTYLADCCVEQIFNNNGPAKDHSISLPLTLQYSPFRPQSKVRPYLGAGLQLTDDHFVTQSAGDALTHTTATDIKYISILFTQGITFEISTRIQLTESIHFVPDQDKTLGIDIGIGYSIR